MPKNGEISIFVDFRGFFGHYEAKNGSISLKFQVKVACHVTHFLTSFETPKLLRKLAKSQFLSIFESILAIVRPKMVQLV